MPVRIFWVLIIGFALGVFIRSHVPLGLSFALWCCALGVAVALARTQESTLLACVLIAFGLGALRMHMAVLPPDSQLDAHMGAKTKLTGIITAEPDVRDHTTRIQVRNESGAGILIVALGNPHVAYGDRIRATGTLAMPQPFDTGLGRQFNYPAYLAKDGVRYELDFAAVTREGSALDVWHYPQYGAIWLKQRFIEGLGTAVSEPQAGLGSGITVGDKRGMGPDWADTFRTVGLTHIIVLSGSNITVVIGWANEVLAWASASMRYGIAGCIALFFALMTGGTAAAVRAGIMVMVAIIAKASGRLYLASRALAVTAAGMVIWNPYLLAFDPGFQLSVLATAGLIWVSPMVAVRLWWVTERLGLREAAATTIGTQATVLPLLLYQTGNLSLVALPANLLALVAVPWAFAWTVVAGIAGLSLGPLATIAGFPAYALLSYILGVADGFAHLPFASVSLPGFSGWWLVPLYGVLAALVTRHLSFRASV
jgi:competence protein ComEC